MRRLLFTGLAFSLAASSALCVEPMASPAPPAAPSPAPVPSVTPTPSPSPSPTATPPSPSPAAAATPVTPIAPAVKASPAPVPKMAPPAKTAPKPKALPAPPAASDRTTKLSLFFPIDKNNIQILPQRFEYELIDKDQFRVGNALFDAKKFKFEVKQAGANNFKFSIQWPAALLGHGEISIRDNIGKSIWTQPINRDKVKFQRITNDAGISTVVASLSAQDFPVEVFSALKYVPYFRTCVQRTEPPIRISLCSKDFFFRHLRNKFDIQSRDSLRPESFVNINGNNVDPRGLVFLQGTSGILGLRVLLLSGATLDIDTRMKAVDFRDLSISEDGDKLQIWAAGAEPTAGLRVSRLEDGSWKTEINMARPIIYLKGEGDIPMKQEFITQGTIREQRISVEAIGDIPMETYSSSVTLKLKKTADVSLLPADALSKLENDGDAVNWTLLDLANWNRNRRLLKVASDDQQFTAAWDVTKYPAWELRMSAGFPTAGRMQVRRWFNGFRFGTALDYKYILSPYRSGDGNSSRARLKFYYTFDKMVQYEDSSWGALLAPEFRQWGNATTTGAVLGFFMNRELPASWKYLGQWNHTEFDFGIGSGTPSYQTGISLKTDFIYRISKNQFWLWGLEYGRGTLKDTSGDTNISRAEIDAGFIYLF